MIDQAVILARADELHITANAAEVDSAIDTIKSANQIDDTQLDAALSAQGMSRAQYRVELTAQIRIQRTLLAELASQVSVNEDDILKAYAERRRETDAPPMDAKMHDELKQQLFMKRFEVAREPWLKRRRALSHVEKLS
jgi:parvulin-like peptidyl-prolyl isomerase